MEAFSSSSCLRNPFGLEVEANFLTTAGFAGDVVWGPELAALDSDGDGATNGMELGDPDGTWVAGDADPEGEAFAPGDPDRGQPTYFYPRTTRFQFSVEVPGNMGTAFGDGLVWTVTHHGSEQQAIGWLQAEWEIDEETIIKNTGIGFGRAKAEWYINQPPSLSVTAAQLPAAVGQSLTLTAVVEDDALPRKLPPRVRSTGQSRSGVPALRPPVDAPGVPDNVRWYRRPRPPRNGLSVHWVLYRGPAVVAIDPSDFQRAVSEDEAEPSGTQHQRSPSIGPVSKVSTSLAGDGWTSATFETTVTFAAPGTYTLRAFASDAMRFTPADLTVTVTAP